MAMPCLMELASAQARIPFHSLARSLIPFSSIVFAFSHLFTASAELRFRKPVQVVVPQPDLEHLGLLQLDGDVGERDAVADHRAVLGG